MDEQCPPPGATRPNPASAVLYSVRAVPRRRTPPMRALLIAHNSTVAQSTDFDHLDRDLAVPGNQVWLDIEHPQEDDIARLREKFHFHPLAIEDATRASERPKDDLY